MTGRPSPHEPASAPSRNALVAFFGEINRIVRHRHAHDQAALATRPDLERQGVLPKGQGTDGDEEGNMTEPRQREAQVARALVR